jgi:hypothetical protein
MSASPFTQRHFTWQLAGLLILTSVWPAAVARAQTSPETDLPFPFPPAATSASAPAGTVGQDANPDKRRVGQDADPDKRRPDWHPDPPPADPAVVPAGCSTCGSGLLGALAPPVDGPDGCSCCGGGCGSDCYPGRNRSYCCCGDGDSCLGRLFGGIYHCICCPDPCYEPRWIAAQDSAFFVDSARPITQLRYKIEGGFGVDRPERAEFFFARSRTIPNQLEPGPTDPKDPAYNCFRHGTGKGPAFIASEFDHEEFSMYMEGATEKFGFFIEMPYREVDPKTAPSSVNTTMTPPQVIPACSASGFSDMNLGTKAVLVDCELLLLTLQFKTFIPIGDFGKGLGTGHVSLEPALLYALKLAPETYLQFEFAYWIPIGGDPLYEGNIYHAHFSLNRTLWCPCPGLKLVGTLEASHWVILGGNYTDPNLLLPDTRPGAKPGQLAPVAVSASDEQIFSAGPGVRLFICDKIDFGIGTQFALTSDHWEEELVRAEFRWRF